MRRGGWNIEGWKRERFVLGEGMSGFLIGVGSKRE